MKIHISHNKRRDDGLISVIFLILMAIMVILIAANSRALARLHRETKWLEQQQALRLSGGPTNLVTKLTVESK